MDWSLVAFSLANNAHYHYSQAHSCEREGNLHGAIQHLTVGDTLKAISEALNFGVGHDEVNHECTTQRS